MITKSVAGVAAGVLLVGGGVVATAQPTSPSTTEPDTAARTVTGPAVITRADDSAYPGSTATTTSLRIRSRVEYRAENVARVVVDDGAADGNPQGTVTLVVAGRTRTATLRRGAATVVLPRSLKPGEYAARADFASADDTLYQSSRSAVVRLRVVKSGSSTFVDAARIARGERPTVRVWVEGDNFVTPRGPVTVRITTRGERHTEGVHLFNGQAVVRFPKVDRRGRWDVRAVYGGSRVVKRSVGTDRFRVTR